MNLRMTIKNIKCIKELKFEFPIDPGIYAITGENGSGKSTLISCASTVFYQMPMNEYFGLPKDAEIDFELNGTFRKWKCKDGKWLSQSSSEKMQLNGFYEGSIIFGNRFKNTRFSIIKLLDNLSEKEMKSASLFVTNKLGEILHNDPSYYKDLYELKKHVAEMNGLYSATFFTKNEQNELISQPRMSTGENLLLSILKSLDLLKNKRERYNDGRPCIVFLDEIELALHSSALRRLILFLKQTAEDLNLSIFFSTHSIELLREIKSQNIYYISRNFNGSTTITNPCYPAYATRNLYGDDGYGNDIVVLVEDDLAKLIIEKILRDKDLARNIRIKILPTGGWTNTITMAYDIISSNLLQKGTRLVVILDGDIQKQVPEFIKNHKNCSGIKIDYLPIPCLEKYIKNKLLDNFDQNFYSLLDTYLFQKRPLNEIINQYKREHTNESDEDGKTLYGTLLNEIRSMRKERDDLIELVNNYIQQNEETKIEKLENFLRDKILN